MNKENKTENAIVVKNVSKRFVIPHEKISTLKGAFVSFFKKKDYEVFDALKDVSFEVKKGEFFGIIGRNGSGKSTLLKILAGIYVPNKGSVKIHGHISPFLELGIGFNPELSGRDNIYLNGTVLGLTKKQIDEKFNDIVAFSELERFIDQKLKNYSSGMSVRLAFSVAIHANRDILLMDEVLAVGDSNFQSKCLREFIKYKEQGKTVVLVSHDITTIQRYCDRALLLRNGKIEKIGSSEEVGNEYVYQNMSDEEKRIFEEQRKNNKNENQEIKAEEPKPEKIAEILDVKFLDKDGKEKNMFMSGEDIKIKVCFKKKKEVNKINIGIGLYKDDNTYVFSYNTQMDDYVISRDVENVTLSLDSNPLLKGNYFVKCVCFGELEESFYDFKEKSKNIQVFSVGKINQYRGVVNINHDWK